MNFSKIFCLTVLAALSANVSAMQIYKGKIVSQKIWTNDSSKGKVAANSKNIIPLAKHRTNDGKYVLATVDGSAAKANEPIDLNNSHFISIVNSSESSAQYVVTHFICSETPDVAEHCVFYSTQIALEAGGSYTDATRPVLTMTYNQPGHYHISAASSVFNVKDSSIEMTANSTAGSSVDVA